VELAKYYEHRTKDVQTAEALVLRAIDLVQASAARRGRWWTERRLGELEHRLRRVQLKRARHEDSEG
jgi:hypothetical protein